MTEGKHIKYHDIPFLIDGTLRFVKSVTKYTICNDVINKLPKLHAPLSVYESKDGVEKKLSGKTKLLKIWRAYGASKKVMFVVRKSELNAKKKHKRGLLSETNKCEQPIKVRSAHGDQLPITKDQLKQASDLAFYIRYQQSKIQTINKKSSLMDNTSQDVERNIMTRITSNSSVNSMDAFLAKADLDNLAQILSFCGTVTAEKLGANNLKKPNVLFASSDVDMVGEAATHLTVSSKISKRSIQQSLKTMKIGIKQKFTSKSKIAARTTSTGSISSTDTGFHSVTSEDLGQRVADGKYGARAQVTGIPRRYAFIDSNLDGVARHSTPVIEQSLKRKVDDIDTALDIFDETDGKTVILQKFMADQTFVDGRMGGATDSCKLTTTDLNLIAQRKRRRTDGQKAFTKQEEKCRHYWNNNCDSDTDSCCDSDVSGDNSKLDEAFVDSCVEDVEFITPRSKTLRRDLAISNLSKFSLSTKQISYDESTINYSLNYTFPGMNESVDFSYSFDDSIFVEDIDASLSDESMDSFMKTRSTLVDHDDEIDETNTKAFECESGDDVSLIGSDEGLGSMTSDSVSDCREMTI